MKAIVQRGYGRPEDVLSYEDVDVPQVGPLDLRVRVAVAALNAYDWHFVLGEPLFMRVTPGVGLTTPKRLVPGRDVAGVVEEVGADVTGFAPGDRVVGHPEGCLAEQVVAPADQFVGVPAAVELDQAVGLPMAAVTALQGFRKAGVGEGTSVLVAGASGGVGTYAVQLAANLGATVTGVCSTRNVDLALELGCADVVDYTTTDVTRLGRRWDMVLVNSGLYTGAGLRRILAPGGTAILMSGDGGRVLGPLPWIARAALRNLVGDRQVGMLSATSDTGDVAHLLDLLAAGRIRTVVDRTFALSDGAAALAYQAAGHARGKVLVRP